MHISQNKHIRDTNCSVRGEPSNHGQPTLRQAQGEREDVFDKLHLQVVWVYNSNYKFIGLIELE